MPNSLSRFSEQELADYLRSGNTLHGAAYGPMAETIYGGLHALTPDDALKMAHYLKQRPAMRDEPRNRFCRTPASAAKP